MRYPLRPLLFACLILGIAGCGIHHIHVTGYLDPSCPSPIVPGSRIYVVQNADADNPILEKEVASKIERLVEEKGYTLSTEEDADFHLFFSYGMGIGPVRSETISHPQRIPVYDAESKTTRYETVYHSSERCVQHYASSLSIRVMDSKKMRESDQVQVVWAADTTSEGKNTDLRDTLNYLLVATFDYFGQDTGKAVGIIFWPYDKRVDPLRAKHWRVP